MAAAAHVGWGWCHQVGIAAALARAVVITDDKAVDQRVVGCAGTRREGKHNGIAQAEVGGYITKIEADGGITNVARLWQGKVERLAGADAGCMRMPYIAARHLEADVVSDPRAIAERRQRTRREVQTRTRKVHDREVAHRMRHVIVEIAERPVYGLARVNNGAVGGFD